MPTIRLIYASDAIHGLRYADFIALMARAEQSNSARDITGMLCYGSGRFLQALEGDRQAVNALYHHIAIDPRHAHCQLLSVEEIETRHFAEWSMKIIDWNDAVTATRQALLLKHSGSSQFDPSLMSGKQASTFLYDLAAMERLLLE